MWSLPSCSQKQLWSTFDLFFFDNSKLNDKKITNPRYGMLCRRKKNNKSVAAETRGLHRPDPSWCTEKKIFALACTKKMLASSVLKIKILTPGQPVGKSYWPGPAQKNSLKFLPISSPARVNFYKTGIFTRTDDFWAKKTCDIYIFNESLFAVRKCFSYDKYF